MFIAGRWPRRTAFALMPYWVYVTTYDSLKAFPNYLYNTIHIEDLYLLEKKFFGLTRMGDVLTPNEFYLEHQFWLYDLISGLSYLTWVPLPLAFALVLYLRGNKRIFINFSFVFVLANLLGFIGYYLYPAAPPWYVQIVGFEFIADTPCAAAGMSRFDELIGWPIFQSIYANNKVVFAAMPSMHAANPLSCLLVSFSLKNSWPRILFFLVTCGMWFGAVYSSHHYILDVLGGALVVFMAYGIVYGLLRRTSLNEILLKFEARI